MRKITASVKVDVKVTFSILRSQISPIVMDTDPKLAATG